MSKKNDIKQNISFVNSQNEYVNLVYDKYRICNRWAKDRLFNKCCRNKCVTILYVELEEG